MLKNRKKYVINRELRTANSNSTLKGIKNERIYLTFKLVNN